MEEKQTGKGTVRGKGRRGRRKKNFLRVTNDSKRPIEVKTDCEVVSRGATTTIGNYGIDADTCKVMQPRVT